MNSDLQSIFFTEIIQNSCNDTDELILQHLITMHFALKIVPWAQTYLLSLLIELRLRSSEKVNRPQEYPSWRFLTGSAFTNCAVRSRGLAATGGAGKARFNVATPTYEARTRPLHVQHTYYRIIFKQNPFNIISREVQGCTSTDFRLK